MHVRVRRDSRVVLTGLLFPRSTQLYATISLHTIRFQFPGSTTNTNTFTVRQTTDGIVRSMNSTDSGTDSTPDRNLKCQNGTGMSMVFNLDFIGNNGARHIGSLRKGGKNISPLDARRCFGRRKCIGIRSLRERTVGGGRCRDYGQNISSRGMGHGLSQTFIHVYMSAYVFSHRSLILN